MNALRSVFALVPLCLGAAALAQTGVVDQVNPYVNAVGAGFNCGNDTNRWQQQVQAGIAGKLEGFELHLFNLQGSQIEVRVRMGPGWNTSPAVYSGLVIKQTTSFDEIVFVDTSASNITLAQGTEFVIELHGNNTGGGALGSYVAPPGAPTYPEPFFLNGPGCHADCGWRFSFTTYVYPDDPVVYCNANSTSQGCHPSISANAQPSLSGLNSCDITVQSADGQRTGLIYYGLHPQATQTCFGSVVSTRCVSSPTRRTGVQATGGNAGQCNGTLVLDWDLFHSQHPGALGAPWSLGETAFLQAWFRDPLACNGASFSNALALTHSP